MRMTEMPSFAIPEGVLTREVEGELVLLNLKSEQYYGLDAVGADIVARLTAVPRDRAIAGLCRDYEVEPEVLKADVERLVEDLLRAGLLERTPGS